MLVVGERRVSIMMLCVVALHLWWAAIIFWDESGLLATGVDSLYRFIHPSGILILTLMLSSLMALWGIVFAPAPWWYFVPQQILLLFSAAGSIEAMWLGQFADGVLRPRAFLMTDQIYSILFAVGQFLAIIIHTGRNARSGP